LHSHGIGGACSRDRNVKSVQGAGSKKGAHMISSETAVVPMGTSNEDDATELAAKLGFDLSINSLAYSPDFQPVVRLSCGLIMVPHGKTPSNVRLLFQNHSDSGPESWLIPEGVAMAKAGAAAFVQEYGPVLCANPNNWVMYCSPLSRTKATAEPYVAALREAGACVPEPTVDPDLIEINQGSWHGQTVQDLKTAGRLEDAELAEQYRAHGSFLAKPVDGSGECILQVIVRAAAWLQKMERLHGGSDTNILVFGHGTFQNSVETLLQSYPDKTPTHIFSRVSGGSHLRRGEAHLLAPLRTASDILVAEEAEQ